MMRINEQGPISRSDRFIALGLLAVFFLIAYFSAGSWCFWGDDYAAYISEGIAIAEGRLGEQARLNTLMHPSPLPEEAVGNPLVYVWGYPLLLSLVYRSIGFDRVDFSTIAAYKFPSVTALALIAAVLFLFLRRRFGRKQSLLMTVAFCSCSEFYTFINTLYSDLVFLFFALVSLWLSEMFSDEKHIGKRIALGCASGVSLWCTYEVRLNGSAILLTCILAQIISVFREKKYRSIGTLAIELIPYALFAALKVIAEALLAAPTSNMSDLDPSSLAMIFANLRVYIQLIMNFIGLLWNNLLISPLYSVLRRFISLSFDDLSVLKSVLVWASGALCVIGMVSDGVKRNTHLTLLCIVYIAVASMLPYTQGMRYIYPLLPVLLMYCGYGFSRIVRRLPERIGKSRLLTAVTLLWSLVCIYPAVTSDIAESMPETVIVNVEDIYMQNAYSDAAIEVYDFIRSETPKDCTLAFFAPRGLYLNTERFSIKPDVNGHGINEADYYLDYLRTGDYNLSPDLGDDFEVFFSNGEFVLYQRITGEQQ